jgi:hypothetical protein
MKRVILIFAILIIVNTVSAETFNLKDGTRIDGKIILSNENTLIIEDEEGNKQMVPISSLKEAAASDSNAAFRMKTAGNSFKNFSIFLNVGSAYLLSGKMYDYLHGSITPTPTLTSSSIGVGMDWYFLKYLGISLGCDFYGMQATASQISSSLSIGSGATVKAMLMGRIPFKPFIDEDDSFMGLALRVFAGPTYSTFSFSDDYKSLVEKAYANAGYTVRWYTDPATGIGAIGGIGLLFENNHFGCGLDVFAQDKTIKWPADTIVYDWFEIGTAVRVSFDF